MPRVNNVDKINPQMMPIATRSSTAWAAEIHRTLEAPCAW